MDEWAIWGPKKRLNMYGKMKAFFFISSTNFSKAHRKKNQNPCTDLGNEPNALNQVLKKGFLFVLIIGLL